ncbi:hypothetical protein PGTUg99_003547 [Puccinia graminis f. sp. tritici]|uniref:Uncharacterized protein n=1 Tax=Puccinia graminis f. sp. tritici TaxID=56615 RepID=A0A5B0LGJ8_PUCGR|nr:hypothetical protein PGTUg99_003547 [Puccinia graminis f. sp. tritici]
MMNAIDFPSRDDYHKTSTALKEPSERLSSEDSSPGDSSSDDSSSDDSSSGDSSGPDHRERREGRSEKPSDKKNETRRSRKLLICLIVVN